MTRTDGILQPAPTSSYPEYAVHSRSQPESPSQRSVHSGTWSVASNHGVAPPTSDDRGAISSQNDPDEILAQNDQLVYQILETGVFDNPEILDSKGRMLYSQNWAHWIRFGVGRICDLMDHKGEILRDMYHRLPREHEGRMLRELELLCRAIPQPWRDFMYDHHVKKEQAIAQRQNEFARFRRDINHHRKSQKK